MRKGVPVLRCSLHARKEQAQQRQAILIIHSKALKIEAKARSPQRQEINSPEQRDPDPVHLRGGDAAHLRGA